ncbi:Transcription enhancer protein [Entamoeba marina]
MTNPDPDLQKSNKYEQNQQEKIASSLLELLKDETNDVKDISIKCMTAFAPFVTHPNVVKKILENLKETLVDTHKKVDVHRDVAVEVVKELLKIFVINKEFKLLLQDHFAVPLLNFFSKKDLTENSIGYNLDVLDVIITQNGCSLEVSKVTQTLLPYLDSGVFGNRRRAVRCLSHLSKFATETELGDLLKGSLTSVKSCSNKEQIKVYNSLFSSISMATKDKFAPFVKTAFDLLKEKFESAEEDTDDDLKEAILNTYNIFVCSCPLISIEMVKEILACANEYVQYDPNKFEFSGEDEDAMEEEEEEEIFEDDEEDITWKLRKLAGDCLISLIQKRDDIFVDIINDSLPILLKRMKESVEILIHQLFKKANSGVSVDTTPITDSIKTSIPQLVSVLNSQRFKEKSKIACVHIMTELARFNGSLLMEQFSALEPVVVSILKTPKTHVEILFTLFGCINEIVQIPTANNFSATISPILVSLFNNKNFRIAIDAIKTESILLSKSSLEAANNLKVVDVLQSLLTVIKSEKDHEIKEQAVLCVGVLLQQFKSVLDQQVFVNTFNEITSLYDNTFLRSSALIVVRNVVCSNLLSLTKKCRYTFHFHNCFNTTNYTSSLPSISGFIYDSDLTVVDLAISILSNFASIDDIAKEIATQTYGKIVDIAKGNNAREGMAAPFISLTSALSTTQKKAISAQILDIQNHVYSRTNLYLTGLLYAATKPDVSAVINGVDVAISRLKKDTSTSADFYKSIVLIYAASKLATEGQIETDTLKDKLLGLLDVESDLVRQACSLTLGSLPNILGFLFEKIKEKKTFAIMNAMKEAVKYIPITEAESVLSNLNEIGSDEKIILPLAECYGRVISANAAELVPKHYVPGLKQEKLNAALIGSIKTCMISSDAKLFIPLIPLIVARLGDKTPAVKAALFAVTSYMLNHAQREITPYIHVIVEHVVPQLSVDKDYISIAKFCKVVHITDHGLDARKAVFDCASILIDNFISEIDCKELAMAALNGAVNDTDHDIKLVSFSLLTKMVSINADIMIENIEALIEPMRGIIAPSLDEKSKEPDSPKQAELSKAVCRFVAKISTHPLAFVSSQFEKAYSDIKCSLKLGPFLKTLI